MFQLLPLGENVFEDAGIALGRWSRSSPYVRSRRFQAFFGVSATVCSEVWRLLLPSLPRHTEAKHLLWALMFLKGYNAGCVNAAIADVDEKTFRKWCWCLVNLIADLSMRRLDGSRSAFKASVDGTDFRIREPTPFNYKWYSHKFKGPGLRYEVGVSIRGGEVIWAHGPFPCGSYSDLKIFRMGMKKALLRNEKVVNDGEYQDSSCSYPLSTDGVIDFPYVRARHEAINKTSHAIHGLREPFPTQTSTSWVLFLCGSEFSSTFDRTWRACISCLL